MKKNHDLTGRRFGLLVVQSRAGSTIIGHSWEKTCSTWLCLCDCGATVTVSRDKLRSGKKRYCSMGRHKDERARAIRAGAAAYFATKERSAAVLNSLTYSSWEHMNWRCAPNGKYVKHGTKVCERWRSFENFLADMGPRPGRTYSIERENVRGDYEPKNCVWATTQIQAENRRNTRWVFWDGDMIKLVDLCREKSMPLALVGTRLSIGWPIEKAISLPVQPRGGRHAAQHRQPQHLTSPP